MAINFDHTMDTISASGGGSVGVTNIDISEVESISFADNGGNSQVWLIEEDLVSPTNALVFDYNNVERIRFTPSGDIQLTGSFLDSNGNIIIDLSVKASSVNYVQICNAATGNDPAITVAGDDTNVDLSLVPKGTGSLIFDGLIWPSVDGTNGQALTTDGSGNLNFTTIVGGGGLNNVVEDTTPQLGGNLDNNGFGISTDGNLIVEFTSGGELAVNNLEIEHAITGVGPTIRSVGTDTDIDLNLEVQGAGNIILDGLIWPAIDGTIGQILTTDGSSNLSFTTVGGTGTVTSVDVGATFSGFVFPTGPITTSGTHIIDHDWTAFAAPGAIVTTDLMLNATTPGGPGVHLVRPIGDLGIGAGGFLMGAVVDDSSPVLGGNLDVGGFEIVSTSSGDIFVTPDGAGSVVLDGLIWPSVDGTDGEVLTTDGSGNLTFTTVSGEGRTVATVQTTDATVTTLASISLTSGSTVTVRGFGMAQGPSQASVGFNFTACGHNAGGTSVRDGRIIDTMDDNTNNYALDIDVDDASDTMRIRVTGIAATTIDWRVEYETVEEA